MSASNQTCRFKRGTGVKGRGIGTARGRATIQRAQGNYFTNISFKSVRDRFLTLYSSFNTQHGEGEVDRLVGAGVVGVGVEVEVVCADNDGMKIKIYLSDRALALTMTE